MNTDNVLVPSKKFVAMISGLTRRQGKSAEVDEAIGSRWL